jgi:hypothetical protein
MRLWNVAGSHVGWAAAATAAEAVVVVVVVGTVVATGASVVVVPLVDEVIDDADPWAVVLVTPVALTAFVADDVHAVTANATTTNAHHRAELLLLFTQVPPASGPSSKWMRGTE